MRAVLCAFVLVSLAVAGSDDMNLPQAESLARAERAKVAQHTAAVADAKAKLGLKNLTPQERKYISGTVEAQSRYLQEATTRAIKAEAVVTRLKSEAAVLIAAAKQENAAVVKPTVEGQAQAAPAKTSAQALQVVTFMDGTTLDILRYVEVDDAYSLQTVDKKFKTVKKDTVKSIDDKKPTQ